MGMRPEAREPGAADDSGGKARMAPLETSTKRNGVPPHSSTGNLSAGTASS